MLFQQRTQLLQSHWRRVARVQLLLGMEGCVGSGTGEVTALACRLALLKAKIRFGRAQTAVGNTRSPELLAPSSSVVVLPEMRSPVMFTAASWPFLVRYKDPLVLPPSLCYCFLFPLKYQAEEQ